MQDLSKLNTIESSKYQSEIESIIFSVLKVIDGFTELVFELEDFSVLSNFYFIDFLCKVKYAQVANVVFHGLGDLAFDSDVIYWVISFPLDCLFHSHSL
jgi:hypothetical protein